MNRLGLIGVCGVLALLPGCKQRRAPAPEPLLCYVGGTMRPAMEKLAAMYRRETGQPVEIDYGDSGSNFIKIKVSGKGDLYVAHDPYLGPLLKQGLGAKGWNLAVLTPVIVVKRPGRQIRGLKDLARPGVRIGLTDERYSTLGHICPLIFEKAGLRAEIEKNVATRMKMGGQVANAVAIGSLDAAIVWNAVAHLRREKLEAIPIEPEYRLVPGVDAVTSATYGRIDMARVNVFIATLNSSRRPEAARAFAAFAASRRGREVFAELGFSPAEPPQPSSREARP